jgi:hypothetical protein
LPVLLPCDLPEGQDQRGIWQLAFSSAPVSTTSIELHLRRQTLYPTELWARMVLFLAEQNPAGNFFVEQKKFAKNLSCPLKPHKCALYYSHCVGFFWPVGFK